MIRNESLKLFPASRQKLILFCAVIRESPGISLKTKVTKADRRPFPEGSFSRAEQWSGGLRVVVPPGPISNPEVKRDIADGSASIGHARVGRRQSLTAPWLNQSRGGFLLLQSLYPTEASRWAVNALLDKLKLSGY